MKSKTTLLILALVALGGCASQGPTSTEKSLNNSQPVAEQRLTNDFKRQGVKVTYKTFGGLEAIEATGYAPVWGNSANAAREAFRVAELEAKKSLNDFINNESIRSSTSVAMISRNLEKAKDERETKANVNRSLSDSIISSDEDLIQAKPDERQESSSLIRNDALQIASRVSSEITTRNQGILSGLRLVESEVVNEGREVLVVLRWDQKNEEARKQIRKLMGQ
jgi:hypothetical protein